MRSAARPFAGGGWGAQEGLAAKDALGSVHIGSLSIRVGSSQVRDKKIGHTLRQKKRTLLRFFVGHPIRTPATKHPGQSRNQPNPTAQQSPPSQQTF
jgi:hypothetical protein